MSVYALEDDPFCDYSFLAESQCSHCQGHYADWEVEE